MVHPPAATSGDQRSAGARLASEIKRLRGDAGLSQPQLARRVGYSRQYVSLVERVGQNLPSADLVRSLDKALKDLALPDINKSGSSWSQSLVMIDVALSHIRSKESDLDYAAEMVLDALRISSDRPIVSIQRRTSEFVRDAVERWGDTRQTDEICDAMSSAVAR